MGLFDFLKSGDNEREPSFRYEVVDVFSITGRGLVVVGMVEKGSVNVGDKLTLSRKEKGSTLGGKTCGSLS